MPKKRISITVSTESGKTHSGIVTKVAKSSFEIYSEHTRRTCNLVVAYPYITVGDIVTFTMVSGTITSVSFERRAFASYIKDLYDIAVSLPKREIIGVSQLLENIYDGKALNVEGYSKGVIMLDQLYFVK